MDDPVITYSRALGFVLDRRFKAALNFCQALPPQ
jgi:hypothetical protein